MIFNGCHFLSFLYQVMVTLDKSGHVISETAILYAMFGTTMTGLLNRHGASTEDQYSSKY